MELSTSENLIAVLKVLLTTLLVLSIPFVLNHYLEDFNWSLGDFLAGGLIIFLFGIYLTIVWKSKRLQKRKSLYLLLGLLFVILVWIELAVGILGTPFSGN